jgi:hypothetical protein
MLWKIHQRLTYLDKLIRLKATGSPKELAKKLCITERSWYKFRDELVNDLALPIAYCSFARSYVYTEEGAFVIGFKKLPKNETEKLNGGKSFFLKSKYRFRCFEYGVIF